MQHRLEARAGSAARRFRWARLLALAAAGSGCGEGRAGSTPIDNGPALAGSSGEGDGVTAGGGPRAGGGSGGRDAGANAAAGAAGVSSEPVPGVASGVRWETRTLSTLFTAEGADAGDLDGDGVLDLVAGPIWYKGPDFAVGGTLLPNPPAFSRDQYSTFFLTFVDDVDGDGKLDVLAIGDAGGGNGSGTPNAFWYRNPGPDELAQPWVATALYAGLVGNESPAFADVTGDGRRELVFITDGELGHAVAPAGASETPGFMPISSGAGLGNYTHGLGVGDVDGDGVADVVERTGWWRQRAGRWERHPFEFWMDGPGGRSSNWGGAQMYVYDVDGDGDGDVVTGLAAHQYGLAWFEQTDADAGPPFVAHEILSTGAGANNVSQLHALAVADVNGDGLPDLIAGKRYYAHPSNDPDPGTTDPAILSWFELARGPSGASFTQHVIHEDSGAGCSFVARDLNGDGKVDVLTSNKRGTFLHLQR